MERTKFKKKEPEDQLILLLDVCQETGDINIKIPAQTLLKAKSMGSLKKDILDNVIRLQYKNQTMPIKVSASEDLFLYLLLGIYLCWHNYSVIMPFSKKGVFLPKDKSDTVNLPKNQGGVVTAKRKPKSTGFGFVEDVTIPPKSKKVDIETRADVFMPLAKQLSDIISTKKNIKHTLPILRQWAHEIRRLSEQQGVSIDRIEQVLDWYAQNIGGEYIPVVESGISLRSKFLRLETAMTRKETSDVSSKKPFIEYDGIRYQLCKDGYYRDASGNPYIE